VLPPGSTPPPPQLCLHGCGRCWKPRAATGIFETVEGAKRRTGSMAVGNHHQAYEGQLALLDRFICHRYGLRSSPRNCDRIHMPNCSVSNESEVTDIGDVVTRIGSDSRT
jgi:hypothetical protein